MSSSRPASRGPEAKATQEWSPPAGDWLSRHCGSGEFQFLGPLLDDLSAGDSRSHDAYACTKVPARSVSSSRSSTADAGTKSTQACSDSTTPSAYSSAPARSAALILARSRGAAIGSASAPARRSTSSTVHSPISPTHTASALAGAIASGRLPKLPVSPERNAATSIVAKLSQAELTNQQQRAKLQKQADEIERLRNEVLSLRQGLRADGPEDSANLATVSLQQYTMVLDERDKFKQQVKDMTKFLSDYGLTWIGDDDDATCDVPEEGSRCETPALHTAVSNLTGDTPSSPSRGTIDVKLLTTKVKELNATVESPGSRVVKDNVGGAVHARIVAADIIYLPLTLFANGLRLGGYEFITYEHAEQLIQDIHDGFFPYLLKDDYPDGVGMEVVDRTDVAFATWLRDHAQNDAELTPDGDRLLPKAGKVIRPNGGSAATRSSSGTTATGRERTTSASHDSSASQGTISLLRADRPANALVARLQVKLDGKVRLVLSMEPSQTIGDLEDAVDSWCQQQAYGGERCPGRGDKCFRTTFPPRTYEDKQQSLSDAGLVPSATLFVGNLLQ